MRHFRYPFSSWSPADVIFVDFGNDGAGTWYIRKEDDDSLPLKMALANREGDMESASFMCRQGYKVWLLDCLDCLDEKVVCPSYVPMNT